MTPAAFIAKWSDSQLRERQGSQEHFLDLCRLLGVLTPAESDKVGDTYCFERGATKVGGGDGWADVWRRACFGWEYKGPKKDLNAALRQLQIYAPDLENPPYLVVSDMERIIVHTNWTNTIRKTIEFSLDDLREPARLDLLRQVFEGSERLKPGLSPQELTAKVASRFGELGKRLQDRKVDGAPKHEPQAVAHFLNRLIFCLFAEDAGLLPKDLFTRTLKATRHRPKHAKAQLDELFGKMRTGGFFGADVIQWFNGGLFDEAEALALDEADLKLLVDTAVEHDWSNIDPAVFGTMFEEALKTTGRRAALGAHYTDREKILKIVDPVIVRPLAAEWEIAHAAILAAMAEVKAAEEERGAVFDRVAGTLGQADAEALLKGEARLAEQSENLELFDGIGAVRLPSGARKALKAAQPELARIARRRNAAYGRAKDALEGHLGKLASFRVLDPACGSGNFLYVALHALRDLELKALVEGDRLGIPQVPPRVGLDGVRGIEIEPYAAELARVTLWIGNLQWLRKNGFTSWAEPILDALTQIECRDALLNPDGSEAEWPGADVIIGNPPFLGGKKLRDGLGDDYVERLREVFLNRVAPFADFVCYWVEKAWRSVEPNLSQNGVMLRSAEGASRSTQDGASFETPAARAPQDDEGGGSGSAAPRPVRAGLVITNSIRGGASRRVLEPIADAEAIFEAWSDEPWMQDGAAVRVSIVCFGAGGRPGSLDGHIVENIGADLTSSDTDSWRASSHMKTQALASKEDSHTGRLMSTAI